MPLANASSASLPPPSHGPGSGWFATPFLHDSFIHYFTPVYPDAIQAEGLPHKTGRLSVEVPPLLLRDLLEERRKHWEGAVGR